jgi:hypothetical protein
MRRSAVLVVLALLLTACSSGAKPSSPDVHRYTSQQFVVPLSVDVPAWVQSRPTELANLLTWTGADPNPDWAIRFLVPVNLYAPGSTTATTPPSGAPAYLTYLHSQVQHGAKLADEATRTVGGRPATVVTATTATSLDGSIGCPAKDAAAPDCYGLQSDLTLRIAVVDAGATTLLIWARVPAGDPKTAQVVADFAHVLDTVTLRA